MNTNRDQMLNEIRKPGPVYVGVLANNDVVHIQVVKSDLIDFLSAQPENYDELRYTRGGKDNTLHIDSNSKSSFENL